MEFCVPPGKVVVGDGRWVLLDLGVVVISFLKMGYPGSQIKLVLAREAQVLVDASADLGVRLGYIRGLAHRLVGATNALLLPMVHVLLEKELAIAASHIGEFRPHQVPDGTRWVPNGHLDQVEAVALPLGQQELHADAALLVRHPLLHISRQSVVLDGEEVGFLESRDHLLVGLEQDVAVPHVPEMVLGVSDEMFLKSMTRLCCDNRFEFCKVAAAASVLPVHDGRLDDVAFAEVYVAVAVVRVEIGVEVLLFHPIELICIQSDLVHLLKLILQVPLHELLACLSRGLGEGRLLGLHVVAHDRMLLAHPMPVVVLNVPDAVARPVEGLPAAHHPAGQLACDTLKLRDMRCQLLVGVELGPAGLAPPERPAVGCVSMLADRALGREGRLAQSAWPGQGNPMRSRNISA